MTRLAAPAPDVRASTLTSGPRFWTSWTFHNAFRTGTYAKPAASCARTGPGSGPLTWSLRIACAAHRSAASLGALGHRGGKHRPRAFPRQEGSVAKFFGARFVSGLRFAEPASAQPEVESPPSEIQTRNQKLSCATFSRSWHTARKKFATGPGRVVPRHADAPHEQDAAKRRPIRGGRATNFRFLGLGWQKRRDRRPQVAGSEMVHTSIQHDRICRLPSSVSLGSVVRYLTSSQRPVCGFPEIVNGC